jgi:SAM-dependent methyltransferase
MQMFSYPNAELQQDYQVIFEGLDDTSCTSAKVIIPLILELLQPQSMIDIGCGVGSWLAVFKEFGIQDVLGVDVEFLDSSLLQIPKEKYLPFDLKKPLKLDRQFDLVLCLEVAGYIPHESAAIFVNSLTRLGSTVLFSAQIPFQDEQTIQVNRQWPDYWANFFKQQGYVAIDCFRKKIWNNFHVAWWFAQNLLLFVKQDNLESNKLLKRKFENTYTSQLALVQPQVYLNQTTLGLKNILSALPSTAITAVRRKLANQFHSRYYLANYMNRNY